MEKNQMGKYFKYAFGEIFLVVIGILIALSINNWNENRKNRIFEKETLEQILANLIRDRLTLKEIAYNFEKAVRSSNLILESSKSGKNMDSIKFWLADVAQFDRFQPLTNAYEVVKSKGLDLISNKQLRFMLGTYYDDEVQEAIKSIADIEYSFNTNWIPLLNNEALDAKWRIYVELENYDLFKGNTPASRMLKLNRGNYSSGSQKILTAINVIESLEDLIRVELRN